MVPKKEITVRFNANVIDRLPWSFVPSQNEVEVVPGETVLAFYKAENKSETPIIGTELLHIHDMIYMHVINIAMMQVWLHIM